MSVLKISELTPFYCNIVTQLSFGQTSSEIHLSIQFLDKSYRKGKKTLNIYQRKKFSFTYFAWHIFFCNML